MVKETKLATLSLRIPDSDNKELKELAALDGRSASNLACKLLRDGMKQMRADMGGSVSTESVQK